MKRDSDGRGSIFSFLFKKKKKNFFLFYLLKVCSSAVNPIGGFKGFLSCSPGLKAKEEKEKRRAFDSLTFFRTLMYS